MQWTIQKFCKAFTIRSITWALLSALFLAISPLGLVASAQTPNYSGDLQALQSTLNAINNTLANFWNPNGYFVSQNEYDYWQDFLFKILAYDATVSPDNNLLYYVSLIATNGLSGSGSSSSSVASNPWWATNSVFAAHLRRYAGVYPTETPDRAYLYSFPQFMSAWSSKLITPQNTWIGNSANQQGWYNLWGVSSISRWGSGAEVNGPLNGYTWFDWITDAMRSNWISSASALRVSTSNLAYTTQDFGASQLMAFHDDDTTRDETPPATNALVSLQLTEETIDGNPFQEITDGLGQMMPELSGNGSANIVVIPEMTIGGIHVPLGQSDFLSAPPPSRGNGNWMSQLTTFVGLICEWAWRLLTLLGIFSIVRTEYGYWSTLGGSASD